MVDGQQQVGLQQLGLDRGGPDGQDRLLGEHGRPLRHGEDVAGELKVGQIVQKSLVEHVPAAQVLDVLRVKVQVLDILDHLLQPRRDGVAALVRHVAEEQIKVRDPVLIPGLKVPVAHGELIEIAQHGHVQLLIRIHGKNLCFLCPGQGEKPVKQKKRPARQAVSARSKYPIILPNQVSSQ